MVQHPRIGLTERGEDEWPKGLVGKKELQVLQQESPDLDAYCRRFPSRLRQAGPRSQLVGAFTPRYLRSFWAIEHVRQVMSADAPLIVLLRDPIDRFESAMRLRRRRNGSWPFQLFQSDINWSGMYADQLDVWATALGRDRLMVYQYEQLRRDPVPAVHEVWSRLGLDPIPVDDPHRRAHTTTVAKEGSKVGGAASERPEESWEWPVGLRDQLRQLYTPQMERLAGYGMDLSLWKASAEPATVG
jgi:hypothetical protein